MQRARGEQVGPRRCLSRGVTENQKRETKRSSWLLRVSQSIFRHMMPTLFPETLQPQPHRATSLGTLSDLHLPPSGVDSYTMSIDDRIPIIIVFCKDTRSIPKQKAIYTMITMDPGDFQSKSET